MESLLVFYVDYILDDKNTLCNGCRLKQVDRFLFRIFYSNSAHFK